MLYEWLDRPVASQAGDADPGRSQVRDGIAKRLGALFPDMVVGDRHDVETGIPQCPGKGGPASKLHCGYDPRICADVREKPLTVAEDNVPSLQEPDYMLQRECVPVTASKAAYPEIDAEGISGADVAGRDQPNLIHTRTAFDDARSCRR
jgi:hypothetical protein